MNSVRLAIVFYIFAGAATAVLLWRNSANPDALKNAGILFAGVIPALIAILPYFSQRVDTRRFVYALFYDSTLKIFASTADRFAGYLRRVICVPPPTGSPATCDV
jgi:hypothetical protein